MKILMEKCKYAFSVNNTFLVGIEAKKWKIKTQNFLKYYIR